MDSVSYDVLSIIGIGFLILILIFGFVMDAYAVFLRVAGIEGLGEVLAMSNLVQYIARISNVLVIFVLSFAFETGRLHVPVTFIFFAASLVGIGAVFFLIKSPAFCRLVQFTLFPILYPSFRRVAMMNVWREIGGLQGCSLKLAAFSAITNLLIVIAMFIPFGIASYYPEMRMTSVYFGQMMNFFATLLVFAIQDPISMRLIDAGNLQQAGTSLLYGRLLSYCLAALFFAIIAIF